MKKRSRREARAVQLEADGQEQQSLQRLIEESEKGQGVTLAELESMVQDLCAAEAKVVLLCRSWRWSPHSSCKGCEELTEKLEASFKAAAEMAKE